MHMTLVVRRRTAQWVLLLAVTTACCVASAAESLTVSLQGGSSNVVVANGDSIVISGTISNRTTQPVPVVDLLAFVDTVPTGVTNLAFAFAPELFTALGADLEVPVAGYSGPLLSIGLPTGVGPPVAVVCQFGVTSGTNVIREALSEVTSLNLPRLVIQATSSDSVTLVWSNAYFRPSFSTNVLSNWGWQVVTNVPLTNAQRLSTSLQSPSSPRYFRLQEP